MFFYWELMYLYTNLLGDELTVLTFHIFKTIQKWHIMREARIHDRFELILDILSLSAVLHYIVYRFLQSTMFVVYYSNTYKVITLIFLIALGGLRYIYLVGKMCLGYETSHERISYIFQQLLLWAISIPFVYVGWLHDYKFLIFLPLCCMCLYKMKQEKVLKAYSILLGILLTAVIVCCLSGTVRNIVNPSDGKIRVAFGIINTTDFASYSIFLLLAIWCANQNHKAIYSILYSLFTLVLSYIVWLYTDSKTALICGLLIFLLVIWDCFKEHILEKKHIHIFIQSGMKWLSIISFPVIGFLFFIFVKCYGAGNSWALQLDAYLSNRLSTVWNLYQTYGIKMFGNTIKAMHGNGATSISWGWSNGYGYLDSAYALLCIRYGYVVTVIFTSFWMWMVKQAYDTQNNRIALTLLILAIHAFSEARILDVNYNVFLILLFCKRTNGEKANFYRLTSVKESVNVNRIKLVTGLIIMIGVIIVLPKALAWLRSFFSIMSWNSGTAGINALIVCIGLSFLIWLFWKSLLWLWYYKKKKLIILSAAILTILVFGGIIIDRYIEQSKAEKMKSIMKDEPVIRLVQENATRPLYAAEEEEQFQRVIGGFENHLFSTEELGREPKGTILVSSSVEAFGITTSGGKYTQISEQRGLYSYDLAVIDALTQKGYEWKPFFSSVRKCNLADTAKFNNIPSGNILVLEGPKKIVTKNMETDQFSGTYEVCFTLSSFSTSLDIDEVIKLEVLGEAGERTLFQQIITPQDFDSKGYCKSSIIYTIGGTPKVSYAISVASNTTVTINEISWQRIS